MMTNNAVKEEKVFLPQYSGDEQTVWVARNGHSWSIPCGREIAVPAAVAQILRERDTQALAAKAFIAAEAERSHRAFTRDGGEIRL